MQGKERERAEREGEREGKKTSVYSRVNECALEIKPPCTQNFSYFIMVTSSIFYRYISLECTLSLSLSLSPLSLCLCFPVCLWLLHHFYHTTQHIFTLLSLTLALILRLSHSVPLSGPIYPEILVSLSQRLS